MASLDSAARIVIIQTDVNGKKFPVINDGSFDAIGVLRYSRKNITPTPSSTTHDTTYKAEHHNSTDDRQTVQI